MQLLKYRRKCATEGVYVYSDFRTSDQGAPTACPNDTAHTLDVTDSWAIVESQSSEFPLDQAGRARVAEEVHTYGNKLYVGGVIMSVPANTAQADFFVKIVNRGTNLPANFELFSGGIAADANVRFGDTFDGHVVDHDNLLGFGVDLELDAFVDGFPLIAMVNRDLPPPDRVAMLPAGMYLRFRFKSVDALNNSPIKLMGYVVGFRSVPVKVVLA